MTMAYTKKITEIVFKAIDEVNDLLPPEDRLAKSLTLALSGPNAALDSVGLVMFIAAIERQLESQMNISIVLAYGQTMAQEQNPFSTVGTLINYIEKVIVQ